MPPVSTTMADITSYTQSFRIRGGSAPRKSDSKSVRKRNRLPVSCRACRSRRSKCDRSQPCSTCRERGEDDTCSYGGAGTTQPVSQHATRSQKVDLQDRLLQLESLVSQMVSSSRDGIPNPLSPSSSNYRGDKASGDQPNRLVSPKSNIVGRNQWSAILDEIDELRSAGDLGDDTPNFNIESDKIVDHNIFIGASRPASLEEVLQRYLPPKLQVDRLLSRYFNATYVVVPIVHSSQFRRQYEAFWWNPCAVDPVWGATLFAVLCISASISFAEGSENDATQKKNLLAASALCLALEGPASPKLQVVQALLLFTQCKYMASLDPPREPALVLSMVIRLAFQVGLHREPDPSFSPFEREMRRRLWAMCRHFDMMVSYQLGLPSNVPQNWHDTKLPRNLLDDDFDENSSELPPSRPETDVTQVLHFVVKSRLMTIFAQIYDQALSLPGIKPEDIATLEAENQLQYDLIPQSLRIRPMSQSFTSPDHVIISRLNFEFLYQRGMCILHRQGMIVGNSYSEKICLRAAMAMIGPLADLYKEFLPAGQLHGAKWMLSSSTMSDFLLATVILCLALSTARRARDRGLGVFDRDEWTGSIDALKEAHAICVSEQTKSKSAAHVANAASFVLLKLGINVSYQTQSIVDELASGPLPTQYAPEQIDFQLPTPPSQQIPTAISFPESTQEWSAVNLNFNEMLDDPARFDWTAIDRYLNFAAGPAE